MAPYASPACPRPGTGRCRAGPCRRHGRQRFLHHVAQPGGAGRRRSRLFRNDHRPPIALPHRCSRSHSGTMRSSPARSAACGPCSRYSICPNAVVVGADDIQHLGRAAELGVTPCRKDIPGHERVDCIGLVFRPRPGRAGRAAPPHAPGGRCAPCAPGDRPRG